MSQNYGHYFKDWEIAIAKRLISEFKKQWECLQLVDFEDLLQECLIHWLKVKEKFDPAKKASIKTFMAKVIRTELLFKVRTLSAKKRKSDQPIISLDETISAEDEGLSLAEQIPDKSVSPLDAALQSELKERVAKAKGKLTLFQKQICDFLEEGKNVEQIKKYFGKHRSFIDREIERIEKIFKKEGLRELIK